MQHIKYAVCAIAIGLASSTAFAQSKTDTKKTTKPANTTKVATTPVAAIKPKSVVADTAKKAKLVKKKVVKKTKIVPPTPKQQMIEVDENGKQAVVEIKNGNMYVNGDLVSTIEDAKKESHKIVINLKEEEKKKDDPKLYSSEDEMPLRKAMLGVYTEQYGDYEGARISYVVAYSPADDAGLMSGDLITEVGGITVKDARDLTNIIAKHSSGDRVSITYERHGREFHAVLELADAVEHRRYHTYQYRVPDLHNVRKYPSPYLRSYRYNNTDNTFEYTPRMGVRVQGSPDGKGVNVLDVVANSPADYAGLKAGDMIIRLNHIRTLSADDLQDILDDVWPEQRVHVKFSRNGVIMTTYVRFTKEKVQKDI